MVSSSQGSCKGSELTLSRTASSNNEDDEDDDRSREYIVIDDNDDDDNDYNGYDSRLRAEEAAFPETVKLPFYRLDNGTLIRAGDTVELIDRTERSAELLSGDFLRISTIVEDLNEQEVTLEGYRLRRCSYLQPLFHGKLSPRYSLVDCYISQLEPTTYTNFKHPGTLNEVFMLVEASENDLRTHMQQGREPIPIAEVLKKRTCVLTHLDYNAYNAHTANPYAPARLNKSSVKEWIFHNGTLVCRYVHTVIFDHNSVSYSGEVRKLYRRESDENSQTPTPTIISPAPHSGQKRELSVEQIDTRPTKHRLYPNKTPRYSYGDTYCGIGGASEGASQAGFFVKWGLEKDECAMHGYMKNFPSAEHLLMDACDFPTIARRSKHGVDVLHLSCPCCYWSEAHTLMGKNDQENMETVLTVGPILEAVKPRYATLEQAPGLLKLKKHRLWFRKLINEIVSKQYNVRWRVTDQSEYGLPQRRRRLIFLCAKQGLPLPHFPMPVHGPKGSGLAYWVTVGDALGALQVGDRPHDNYHLPEKKIASPRESVDPFTILARCITTSGGDNIHPSGVRRYTPREVAQLQGFPIDYEFMGTRSDATKQAGNAWAPVANTKYFLLLAQFLEAWDLGLIDPEDDVGDLWDYLHRKKVTIPTTTRYLKKLTKTIVSKKKHPLWGRTCRVEAAPRLPTNPATSESPSRTRRLVLDEFEIAQAGKKVIVVED